MTSHIQNFKFAVHILEMFTEVKLNKSILYRESCASRDLSYNK